MTSDHASVVLPGVSGSFIPSTRQAEKEKNRQTHTEISESAETNDDQTRRTSYHAFQRSEDEVAQGLPTKLPRRTWNGNGFPALADAEKISGGSIIEKKLNINLTSPSDRLPCELLTLILEECVRSENEPSNLVVSEPLQQTYWEPTTGGVSFAGVCRTWRKASQYALVYTRVRIPLITATMTNRHIRTQLKVLKSWLGLSGKKSLHIDYPSPYQGSLWIGAFDSYQRGVYSLISNELQRVKSLRVHLNNFIPSEPFSTLGWGADTELDVAEILDVKELIPYHDSQWADAYVEELRVTVDSDCLASWNRTEVSWIQAMKCLDTIWVDDKLGDDILRVPLDKATNVIFNQTTPRAYNALSQCKSAVNAKIIFDMNYIPPSMFQEDLKERPLEYLKRLELIDHHYVFESLSAHLMPALENLTVRRDAFKPHYQPKYDGNSKKPPAFHLQHLIQRSGCTLKKLVIIDKTLTQAEVIDCLNLSEVCAIVEIDFWLCKTNEVYEQNGITGFDIWKVLDDVHVGRKAK